MNKHTFIIGAVTVLSLLAPGITSAHGKPHAHTHIARASICATVPPGHFIASGWLKRHEKPALLPCQILPKGILSVMGSTTRDDADDDHHGTSTADHANPVITNVAVSQVGSTTATITWNTDTFANATVLFATSSPVGTGSISASSPVYSLGHVVALSGLTASTTYFYTVRSTNIFGSIGSTTGGSFTTGH